MLFEIGFQYERDGIVSLISCDLMLFEIGFQSLGFSPPREQVVI